MSNQRTAFYRKLIKPILFKVSPDTIHLQMTQLVSVAGRVPGLVGVIKIVSTKKHPELQSSWQGLTFSSPIGLSAGFDKNGKTIPIMQAIGFGFMTVGSVTSKPCVGNPKPWFYRLPKTEALVVNAGLANDGVQAVLPRIKTALAKTTGFPVVLSVARTNSKEASSTKQGVADYLASLQAANQADQVAMYEINISCPNAYGGEAFTTPPLLNKLLTAIDTLELKKPVTVKMPVDMPWEDFKKLLEVIIKHRVQAVTIANLTKRRDLIDFKEPLPGTVPGGISGAPVRSLSNNLIAKTYQHYGDKLMIIGVGGILSAEDAYQKLRLGATYVELITGLIFNGPSFIEDINRDLTKLMQRDGFRHISEVIGTANKS